MNSCMSQLGPQVQSSEFQLKQNKMTKGITFLKEFSKLSVNFGEYLNILLLKEQLICLWDKLIITSDSLFTKILMPLANPGE